MLSFYDARRLTASLRSLSSPPPPLRHPVISLRGHVPSCVLPITSLRRTAIGSGEGGLMVFSSGSDVVADAVAAAAAAAAAAADGEPTARPSLRKSACRRHLPPFPVSAKDRRRCRPFLQTAGCSAERVGGGRVDGRQIFTHHFDCKLLI